MKVNRVILILPGEIDEAEIEVCPECGDACEIISVKGRDNKKITLTVDKETLVYRTMPEDFMGGDVPQIRETETV